MEVLRVYRYIYSQHCTSINTKHMLGRYLFVSTHRFVIQEVGMHHTRGIESGSYAVKGLCAPYHQRGVGNIDAVNIND